MWFGIEARIYKGLINIVYPLRCIKCLKYISPYSESRLCPECTEGLKFNLPPLLAPHKNSSFDKAWAVYIYEGLAAECIRQFKYANKPWLAGFLGGEMAKFIMQNINLEDINFIVPVPLHWKRLRARGYNQAEALASVISKRLNLPCSRRNLIRIKYTESQINLPRGERLRNLNGAFAVKNPVEFRGRSILLIDDVFTTGATSNECGKALRSSDAAQIDVCALARDV